MLRNDPGLAKQEVRFELEEAQRNLDNIGTLSGRHLSLASFKDASSPLGHKIPSMAQSIMTSRELLASLEGGGSRPITFGELQRIDPWLHNHSRNAIQQVRQLYNEIQYQVACERLGRTA